MSHSIDDTHDPARRSWVTGADGHPDFPIQNLPLGVFSPHGGAPRGGVASGDSILDLGAVAGLLSGDALTAAEAASGATLNPLLALGAEPRRALRSALSQLLSDASAEANVRPHLHAAADCVVHLPCAIGDYTDFYAGIHHATNGGKLFRPDNPLLPNYKHIPIAYHGRASSVRASGTPVRRPNGQTMPSDAAAPGFGPCQRLDYELELGVWLGPGNRLGEPIPIDQASSHIAGYCLLNDWSARDIQSWEYRPLGPFLAKSFITTISCWIVTPEALAPFRIPQPPRPAGDPAPLPYLSDETDQSCGAMDLALEALLSTPDMRQRGLPPHRLALSNARHLYWTTAQMVAHQASNGCDLRPGDLFGTGTISGTTPDSLGSLLELTLGGRQPITLETGEQRRFLEDGDEIVLLARASRAGFVPIGFGACRGQVTPAPQTPK
jgi:fumarylacetoacetase